MIKEEQQVILKCSQVGTQYSYMYWYKQERLKASRLQLVLFTSQGSEANPPAEKEFQGRFKSLGMKNFILDLILEKAKLEDTGTYFCAKQDYTVRQLLRKPNRNLLKRRFQHTKIFWGLGRTIECLGK